MNLMPTAIDQKRRQKIVEKCQRTLSFFLDCYVDDGLDRSVHGLLNLVPLLSPMKVNCFLNEKLNSSGRGEECPKMEFNEEDLLFLSGIKGLSKESLIALTKHIIMEIKLKILLN